MTKGCSGWFPGLPAPVVRTPMGAHLCPERNFVPKRICSTDVTTREQVKLGSGQWPYGYVWCRAYQHRWDDRGWLVMIAKDKTRVLSNLLTCDCGCEREDIRSRASRVLLSRCYAAPVGYPTRRELSKDEALALLIAHDTKRRAAFEVA